MSTVEPSRPLHEHERDLIRGLLLLAPECEALEPRLDSARVVDMNDGGMGSLRFQSARTAPRKLGREVVKAEYDDEDGVLVSITLNVDENGELYELDCWKVDFSPLRRYPVPSRIRPGR